MLTPTELYLLEEKLELHPVLLDKCAEFHLDFNLSAHHNVASLSRFIQCKRSWSGYRGVTHTDKHYYPRGFAGRSASVCFWYDFGC